MEPKKKQTRKSVPRPNSGRRAVDGATDLVKVGVRLSKAQHEWVKANGQHAMRQLIQAYMDADSDNRVLYVTKIENGNWHTISRMRAEAESAMNQWNSAHASGARVFKAFVIEQGDLVVMDPTEGMSKLDYARMTSGQRKFLIKQCERAGVTVPEGLKAD